MLHHTDHYGDGNTALRLITYVWRGQKVVSALDQFAVVTLPPRPKMAQAATGQRSTPYRRPHGR